MVRNVNVNVNVINDTGLFPKQNPKRERLFPNETLILGLGWFKNRVWVMKAKSNPYPQKVCCQFQENPWKKALLWVCVSYGEGFFGNPCQLNSVLFAEPKALYIALRLICGWVLPQKAN
jgi:hypothetical protein